MTSTPCWYSVCQTSRIKPLVPALGPDVKSGWCQYASVHFAVCERLFASRSFLNHATCAEPSLTPMLLLSETMCQLPSV